MADRKASKPELEAMRQTIYQLQGEERLKKWMDFTLLECAEDDHHEWTKGITPTLRLHSWSTADPQHPKVVFSFTVREDNCNRAGNLHGGCTSTLFDFATSMPLVFVNKPGFWLQLGVSRTLNVSYLKPIPCGSKILIECELLSIGKTMCMIRGVMRRESDGLILTSCEHGKYNSDLQVSKL